MSLYQMKKRTLRILSPSQILSTLMFFSCNFSFTMLSSYCDNRSNVYFRVVIVMLEKLACKEFCSEKQETKQFF